MNLEFLESTSPEFIIKYKEIIQKFLAENHVYQVSIDSFDFRRASPGFEEYEWKKFENNFLNNSGYITLVKHSDNFVASGFCYIKSINPENSFKAKNSITGHISKIFVDDKYRGQNIGREILHKMESYLKSKGCEYITLSVFMPNEIAYGFYVKENFKPMFCEMIKRVN